MTMMIIYSQNSKKLYTHNVHKPRKNWIRKEWSKKKQVVKKSHVEHHERAAEKIDGFGDKNHCGAHSSSTLLTCMRKGVKEKEHNKNGWMMEKKKKRRNIYTKRWNKK